jgi:hypothetical protein
MSDLGPGPGVRSLVNAQRQRAKLLEIADYPGVVATPDIVARLTVAKAKLDLGGVDSVRINIGAGVLDYQVGDVELLLGLCCEAYERYDQAVVGN